MQMTAIFLKILNMSLNAGYVILFVCFCRLLMKRMPKKYICVLWAVVLFRLLCPWSIESEFSLLPSGEPISQHIAVLPSSRIESGIEVIDRTQNPVLESSFKTISEASVNPMQRVTVMATIFWCIGIAVMTCYTIRILGRFCRQVREAVPEKGQEGWERIYRCSVMTPLVTGVIRPRFYLPFTLKEPELTHVLTHERIHIRRKDHWFKLLFYGALIIHWYNPLVWAAYRLLERDMEMACDEAVLEKLGMEQKKEYCESLLNLATEKSYLAGNPVAFGESDIKMRIKNLLNFKKPYFWTALVAAAVALAVAVMCLTSPPGTKNQQPSEIIGAGTEKGPAVENDSIPLTESESSLTADFEPTVAYERYESEHGFSLSCPDILTPVIINGQEGFVLAGEYSPESRIPDIFAVITADDTAAETYHKEAVEKYEKETCYSGTVVSDTGTTISYQGRFREDQMLEIYYLVMEKENMLLLKVQMPKEARESYEPYFDGMVQSIRFIK
ncbi:MAG: M56 family metallopeptidase [Lachnospiraceae bacterium]